MSQLRSLLSTDPRQPAGVWSIDPRGQGTALAVLVADQAELSRVSLFSPVTIDSIKILVGTQSGNVDVGVYRFDGTNYVRLASSGSTAVGATGQQILTLTSAVTVQDGDYLAVAVNNGTATLRLMTHIGSSFVGTPINLSLAKATSFPLPASISSPSAGSRTVVLLGYKA
jgi:hypothetical protein